MLPSKISYSTSILLCLGFCIQAADDPQPSPPAAVPVFPVIPIVPDAPGMPVLDLGNGLYRIGSISFDKKARSASFPAIVNMREGLIEYLLVNTKGKVHESLFSTAIVPTNLHLAMLLLGAQGNSRNKVDVPDKDRGNVVGMGPVTAQQLKEAPALNGDAVSISVVWKVEDKEVNSNLEDLVLDARNKRSAARGSWTYTGSVLVGAVFAAEAEHSIIAMITDVTALINNPRPGHDDDTIWLADPAKIPAKGTPVEITIRLEDPKEK